MFAAAEKFLHLLSNFYELGIELLIERSYNNVPLFIVLNISTFYKN